MTPDELDAIEARANAATPGPWGFERVDTQTKGMAETTHQHVYSGTTGVADTWHTTPLVIEGFGPLSGYLPPRHGKVEDAEFIAHARADVPALVAEVRRLLGLVAEVDGLIDEALCWKGFTSESVSLLDAADKIKAAGLAGTR